MKKNIFTILRYDNCGANVGECIFFNEDESQCEREPETRVTHRSHSGRGESHEEFEDVFCFGGCIHFFPTRKFMKNLKKENKRLYKRIKKEVDKRI